MDFPGAQTVKHLSINVGDLGSIPGSGAHSSTLAWKIPWTEEPGAGYCPWGRKESDTTERFHFRTKYTAYVTQSENTYYLVQCRRPRFDPCIGNIPWRRKWQPTPVLLPRKSHGRRSLVQATVHGVTKSWTRLSDLYIKKMYIYILFSSRKVLKRGDIFQFI